MLNQKKIESLLLLFILIGPAFISPNAYSITVDGEIEEILESTNNISALDFISNDTDSSKTKQSLIDHNTWYEGETIKVVHSPVSHFIPLDYSLKMCGYDPDIPELPEYYADSDVDWTITGHRMNSYHDDFDEWYLEADPIEDPKGLNMELVFVLPVFLVGDISFDLWCKITNTNADEREAFKDSSVSIGSEHIGGNGITFKITAEGQYSVEHGSSARLKIEAYDYVAGKWEQKDGHMQSWAYDYTMEKIEMEVQYFEFEPDDITEHIKTYYKYGTSLKSIIHKAFFWVLQDVTILTVTYPKIWTYFSISPIVSVTDSNNILTITGAIYSQYTLLFSSSLDNFLPLFDVSNMLLVSNGFEDGQYLTDWTNSVLYPYEDISIETGITYAGYYSLKLTQSSGTSGNLIASINGGKYYVTASVYIESISGGAEEVYLDWTNGTWQFEHFDTTILNKWQSNTFYCDLSDISDNFGLRIDATTAIVYFDFSSLFFTHSATIQNINSEEQLITIDYLNLDGYKNLNAVYLGVITKILNSSTDVLIANTTGYTNEFGSFEWITNLSLVPDEYYIYTYPNPVQEPVGQSTKLIIVSEGIRSALNPIYPTPIKFSATSNYIPDAAGTITQLTACGTTPNWNCINDPIGTPDDDTTYVAISTGTLKDTYNIPDHTTENGIINSVTVYIRVKKIGSADDFKIVVRSGGSYYYWDVTPNYAWNDYSHAWTTDPSGGAWTWDDIDNLQIGVEEYASDGGPRCTQVYAVVTYTPDTTDPVLNSPSDLSYETGQTGNDITWNAVEINPDKYVVYKNNSEFDSGSYSNGVDIVIDVDGISAGLWNMTMFVNDTAGNSDTDLVWLTVGPDSAPTISDLSKTPDPALDSQITSMGCTATDFSGVDTVLLYYKESTEGSYQSVEMILSGGTYNASNGYFDALIIVNWYIWANDTLGKSDSTSVFSFTVQFSVKIRYYFTPQSIPETPTLNVLDLTFYMSSTNNTYSYDIHLDETYNGIYTDLETILKNNTIGSHNLTYVFFSNSDNNIYLSSTYNYYYDIDPPAFSVNVESFYLSDLYINTYATSNYDYDYYLFEDNRPEGDGVGFKEGTTITSDRNTTEAITIAYAIKFVYNSEIIWFNTSYSNSRSAFYVESYTVDIQEVNVEIVWTTTKSSIDSLTVYENTVLKVDGDEDSPSSWVKSTSVGIHYVTLIFDATDYGSIIYSFNYEIVLYVFEVNVESFYLSELYINTYVTASDNGNYQVYENNTAIGAQGTLHYVGTSIQSDRNLTEDAFLNYAIKFWNTDNDIIWFNTTYSNTEGDFFVNDYSVNIGDTTITITWATSLPDYDKLTVKEDGATKVLEDTDSPSDWTKSTVVGIHSVTLLFQADGYVTITYSFNYHIYAVEDFRVDIGSFQVSDSYVNTYATANYDGDYYVYEDNSQIDSGILSGSGTVIETNRNTTEGVTIAYAIKFTYDSIEIWFNTSYSNPVTHFYLTDYRVDDGATITVTWNTTLMALDSLTVYEDGILKVDSDPDSPSSWSKSIVVGNHYVTLIFSASGYDDIIHSFAYTVYSTAAFVVSLESFYLSDLYVNTYITSNYDGTYIVYEDSTPIDSGTLHMEGTTIITNRDVTPGASVNYTIAFTYLSEVVTFQVYYNNPSSDFFVTEYSIDIDATITVTWDTSKNTIDSLTIIEDGIEKVTEDSGSPTSWTKSTEIGNHHVTLIFKATDYNEILFSFVYTVSDVEEFTINVQSFYMTDDYVNLYCTSNLNYSYIAYTNSTETGSGNGVATGTYIIIPKLKEAGLWNFTLVFTNSSESVIFMTWYSNLIPPLHPLNDLYREQSQGFYNISIHSNLDFFWIDIYHDHELIIDDSTATFFSIEKGLRVGWHNITVNYIYNVSTNAEGYPVNEYNITLSYEFNYETTFFYDVRIRYIEDTIGLAISEINVNDFQTYIDGELIQHGDMDDVEIYSNYSYISNYDIRIKNTMPTHSLVVKDLMGTAILSTTIDISQFTYKIIKLPIYRLGMINYDNVTHKIGVKYKPWSDGPWKLSPELPRGMSVTFWFCGGTYGFRLYNATTYYDEAGNPFKLWDEWVDLPPGILPITIEIPLTLEGDIDVDDEYIWWKDAKIWGPAAAVLLFVIALVVYMIIRKRKGGK